MDAFISAVIAAVEKGGWTGYVVIAIGLVAAFLRGTIRPEREMTEALAERDKRFDEALVERDKRYEEMRNDRDYWKTTAQSTLKSLEQLTEVMEGAQRASRR